MFSIFRELFFYRYTYFLSCGSHRMYRSASAVKKILETWNLRQGFSDEKSESLKFTDTLLDQPVKNVLAYRAWFPFIPECK